MNNANNALADLVRIKFSMIIPGLGCMAEILDEIATEHPITDADRKELFELAETIERASIMFGVIVTRVSGVSLGHIIQSKGVNQ